MSRDKEKKESVERTPLPRAILFWGGIGFTTIIPTVIGISIGDSATAAVAAFCGAFVTFVSKLEDIAELSLGPVRAKMRQTIQEATATIKELRTIAASISESTLNTLMGGNFGFEDGLGLSKRLDLHDKIIESLRQIGFSGSEIEQIEDRWRRGIGVIYYRAISPLIDERTVPHQINLEATSDQRKAREGWDKLLNFDEWQAPAPDEMKKYLDSCGIHKREIDEWIEDYRYFLEFGVIRRRSIFATK